MKYALIQGERICQIVASKEECFPVAPDLKWAAVADDISTRDAFINGAVVKQSSVTLVAPTPDQIYDQVFLSDRAYRALVLALNDETFIPGSKYPPAQLKNILKVKM